MQSESAAYRRDGSTTIRELVVELRRLLDTGRLEPPRVSFDMGDATDIQIVVAKLAEIAR